MVAKYERFLFPIGLAFIFRSLSVHFPFLVLYWFLSFLFAIGSCVANESTLRETREENEHLKKQNEELQAVTPKINVRVVDNMSVLRNKTKTSRVVVLFA